MLIKQAMLAAAPSLVAVGPGFATPSPKATSDSVAAAKNEASNSGAAAFGATPSSGGSSPRSTTLPASGETGAPVAPGATSPVNPPRSGTP